MKIAELNIFPCTLRLNYPLLEKDIVNEFTHWLEEHHSIRNVNEIYKLQITHGHGIAIVDLLFVLGLKTTVLITCMHMST